MSGYPASAIVGTFGSACDRRLLVTASARSLPSLMCGTAGGDELNAMGVCPASVEAIARPALLKGTCAMHQYSVSPPLIRKDLIAQMHADAEKILPPQVLDCLNNARPFFTPIYDFVAPQFVFGRVARSATPRPPRARIWASGWQRQVATPRR